MDNYLDYSLDTRYRSKSKRNSDHKYKYLSSTNDVPPYDSYM